ncbi:hypothetical protein P280DRAFT_554170 [Massarina eburnea CBS 473.64]|uniref:Extracellular membrane protein CFEM domain-containing protein n=1 Tax=Massarina eburnea CBS 473.64 TaxID=1395130 RepID=A0A6A6RKF0_9PLEO|nr:hypothetical protein P280DRAFT_554170 [Massarina eburnea CBS 473.64]
MKYAIVLAAFAAGALAVPQQSGTITSAPAAASVTLGPQLSCVATCKAGDVTCQAACLGIARPNESQVIDTNECAAKCDQGDGSPEATNKYAECQQNCFYSKFPSSQTAFGAGNAVASSAASAGASVTDSAGSIIASRTSALASGASGSASGTAAHASGSAGANTKAVKLVGAGLAGFMAIFAL